MKDRKTTRLLLCQLLAAFSFVIEQSNDNSLVERISAVRRDLGNLLFHFTRRIPADDGFLSGKPVPEKSAYSAFSQILKDGKLRGSNGCVKGGHNCVCFSEAPISEMVALFNLAKNTPPKEAAPRYEPYGVAVTKDWLFSKGGRPAIYQPAADYALLPPEMQYRHVTYDLAAGIDFTWEREWRIKTDSLMLDPRKTLVVVPTREEAFDLMYEHASLEQDWDVEGTSGVGWVSGAYHKPKWLAVSLDLLGFTS